MEENDKKDEEKEQVEPITYNIKPHDASMDVVFEFNIKQNN